MTLQRANPVPPGVYWVDVFDPNRDAFASWVKAHADAVKLRVTEHYGPGASPLKALLKEAWVVTPANPLGLLVAGAARLIPDSGVSRDWALFEVLKPVAWDARTFGFPEIAEGVKSSDQTVAGADKEPDITDTLPTTQEIGGAVKSVANAAGSVLGVALGLGALAAGFLLFQRARR